MPATPRTARACALALAGLGLTASTMTALPAVAAEPGIEVIQHALAVDLLTDADGGVAGLTLHVMDEGQRDGVGAVRCRAVVLASGGLGQVFSQSTNPAVSTGDGMALALRAGATLRDLEFVQFHPTVLWLPGGHGQRPLVTEAVRGEGGVLRDRAGTRFMVGAHPLAELAPRDVVAAASTRRMAETLRAEGRTVFTYGLAADADLRLSEIASSAQGVRYLAALHGESLGEFRLPVTGRHLGLNSAAAVLTSIKLGLGLSDARDALAAFPGVRRRF